MHTDHYLEIGHGHRVCEDFTDSGILPGNIAYAIVCDGCSSSKWDTLASGEKVLNPRVMVDFGARALALSARRHCLKNIHSLPVDLHALCLQDWIWKSASDAVLNLALSTRSLDGTVMLALSGDFGSRIYMWGDGSFHLKYRDGREQTTTVGYSLNAPYYLAYSYSGDRRDAYAAEYGTGVKLVTHDTFENGVRVESPVEPTYPYNLCTIFQTPLDLAQITLMSDGVESYATANHEPIPRSQIVAECVNYKSSAGTFVDRRMQFFRRKCEAEKIQHTDDISVASIVF